MGNKAGYSSAWKRPMVIKLVIISLAQTTSSASWVLALPSNLVQDNFAPLLEGLVRRFPNSLLLSIHMGFLTEELMAELHFCLQQQSPSLQLSQQPNPMPRFHHWGHHCQNASTSLPESLAATSSPASPLRIPEPSPCLRTPEPAPDPKLLSPQPQPSTSINPALGSIHPWAAPHHLANVQSTLVSTWLCTSVMPLSPQ
ncbi:hypothetical protein CRENBAI_009199 [Crenichthys baileyi]|uniref:Uncharacterized protein n=1 Tax=Crenichthys baileyi TaxID=28760 RepID=A0AAV9SKX7_9TELE